MSAEMQVFQGYAAHLASTQGLSILGPDDPIRRIVIEGARLAMRLAGTDPDPWLQRLDTLSLCLPLGVGGRSVVLLSRAALADPISAVVVLAHEAHHDRQSDTGGHVRHAWDYLVSSELRARYEAEAYAVGLWAQYLLTGQTPDARGAMAALGAPTYHLDAGDVALAEGILASHVATIRAGVCPPLSTALDLLRWLREHHPDAIVGKAS